MTQARDLSQHDLVLLDDADGTVIATEQLNADGWIRIDEDQLVDTEAVA
jgi:hypothetical protein